MTAHSHGLQCQSSKNPQTVEIIVKAVKGEMGEKGETTEREMEKMIGIPRKDERRTEEKVIAETIETHATLGLAGEEHVAEVSVHGVEETLTNEGGDMRTENEDAILLIDDIPQTAAILQIVDTHLTDVIVAALGHEVPGATECPQIEGEGHAARGKGMSGTCGKS